MIHTDLYQTPSEYCNNVVVRKNTGGFIKGGTGELTVLHDGKEMTLTDFNDKFPTNARFIRPLDKQTRLDNPDRTRII